MTRRKVYDPVVPLFLIGATIAEGVKRRGGKLFRISVVRTPNHQYQIKYTCRAKDANNKAEWCTQPIASEPDVPYETTPEDREND